MMSKIQYYSDILFQLSQLPGTSSEDWLKRIIQADSNAINCERVSTWMFDEKKKSIRTDYIFQKSTGKFLSGSVLFKKNHPRYFKALHKNTGAIIAKDAISDPSTSEFAKKYLIPNNITSMMDIPIFLGKKLLGVICHEHVGKKRSWTKNEQIFARAIADLIALVFESEERKSVERKLNQTERQIRSFAKHLNHLLEDERARIAREIHDELGQQLAGIKIGLSLLKKEAIGNTGCEGKIDEMIQNANDTMQTMRRIATTLRPGILDTLGLIPSIQWLAKEFEKKTGIRCTVSLKVKDDRFEEHISIGLFRICQEALTNITKHSEASEVKIQAFQEKEILTLEISDNGKGIASEKLDNAFSMGLLGMRERANILEADLKINSKVGSGTSIQLRTKLN